MKLVELPDNTNRILPFYLAMEEWVARCLPADDYFFAWQVKPTVICGRHQRMSLEVDMDYCRRNGIEVWRRKSGGGCVFADEHNIMFSYITPSTGVETTFGRYTAMICRMLRSLGFNASPTGRNDVEINGMKVAGNAFYSLPGRSIVHGTMLYDTDYEKLGRALTPSRAKLASKGVKSVPARVTTLTAQGITMSCRDFYDYALRFLCADRIEVTAAQIAEIEEITATYLDPVFLADKADRLHHTIVRRFDGAGEVRFSYALDRGRIHRPSLSGDFFPLADVETSLLQRLDGVTLDEEALRSALAGVDVSAAVLGLDNDKLIELILTKTT